ncbi:E3 ubiquitin-protein ligase RNF185-like [Vigna unguiculata]|uniref:E3 ubiquitin-protein ligase RMA n=1 Tax=Vigna unguiculata TaxID=3917 RepID=A0A4D6M7P3_VIGUN|nr:E3 ubiquitin-protein ligase RNF185-like [Vigna unguiculata]QCD95894.1 E3 ubiquitin-protein ligase RNF5 [Vigna unguiculata]
MEVDLNENLDGIEERLRRLEGAAFRARQRQRRRLSHAPIQIVNHAGEVVTVAHLQDEEVVHGGDFGGEITEETKGKRKASYLVAKALGLRTNEGEGFAAKLFHCNVCLKRAKDPVLTCCGHLFCWACFHKLPLPCSYSKAKECPVCEGEVTDESLTTIYGNSNVHSEVDDEASNEIPPRPCSRRVESTRQIFRN